eukprot:3669917-Rhodomonas_salina.1
MCIRDSEETQRGEPDPATAGGIRVSLPVGGAAQEFWENPSTATFNEMILSPFRHDNRGKFNDWVPMGGEVDPKDGQGENKTFLDPALDLLRHKPGDGKESEKEISISAGTQPPRSVPRLSSNLCASFLRSKLKVGANAGYKSWL